MSSVNKKTVRDLSTALTHHLLHLEQKFKRNDFSDSETLQLIQQIADCAHQLSEQLELMRLTTSQISIVDTIRRILTVSTGAIHYYERNDIVLYFDVLLKDMRPQMKLYQMQKAVLDKL